jgi:signal transduction histidine kinase
MLSWPFLAVVAVILGIAVLVEPSTAMRRATTVTAVAVLVLILHMISRSGRPALASWLLVIGLSVIVTQRAWITGGIHAPVAVFYVMFILMGGILIGMRGAVATAAVCFIGAVVLTVGTSAQWLTPRPGAGPAMGGFVFVMLAIGLALVIQSLITSQMRRETVSAEAVQMLVHDMRSPMQIIRLHLDLLREDARAAETLEHVHGAIGGTATLNRMANSLLDLSRLEAGRMPVDCAKHDVFNIATSVVSCVRVIQPGRPMQVEKTGDPIATCDAELTRRILENLVSNAMKHTDLERPIRVLVAGGMTTVSIHVTDEGWGVPPEQRERMFEPFSADGLRSAAGFESSGLGLAFCRLAAEAQGGSIGLEDAMPHGSVFIVELPR